MPETVDAQLEARIARAVEAHRPQLEQLVDQVLDRELGQLVADRLAARNGFHNGAQAVPVAVAKAATKTCNGCGRELGLDRFEKNRGRCRDCRRRDHETREQRRNTELEPAEPDQPAAIIASELATRADHYDAANARELERWLVAEQTPAGLVATDRGRELAAAID